ncbi:MAG TPA: hypothetical protein VN837_21060 [Chloroflexota bacterium]|nr:hypothetical protein [Chloroflexota bacterium]
MHSTADSREVNDSDLEFGPDPLDRPSHMMEDDPSELPRAPHPYQKSRLSSARPIPKNVAAPKTPVSSQPLSGHAEVKVSPADTLDASEAEPARDADSPAASGAALPPAEPRVLYVDGDDDLAALLDRVEETGSAAIVVLPEGARAVRGVVASRLLKRRAEAAGIALIAVTTDRVAIAQFTAIGVPCSTTVGEARLKLRRPGQAANAHTAPPLIPDSEPEGDHPEEVANQPPDDDSDSGAPGAPSPEPPEVLDPDEAPGPIRVTAPTLGAAGRVVPLPAGRRRWPLALFTIAFVIVLVLSIWVVLFPAATVTITYATHAFDHTYTAALGTSAPGAITLHHTELSETANLVVPGTGTRQVPDGFATGTVTFANQADGFVLVPAGTIVDAQGGSRYATLTDARVPAAVHTFSGSTNGQLNVGVRALVGGPGANVGQGRVTAIEGRLAGTLLVINYAPISGGTMRTEYRVTAADVANAAATLRRQLATREASTLSVRYALSPIRLPGPLTVTAPRVTPIERGGLPYARVAITATTAMQYVHAQDVQRLADAGRDRDLAGRNQQVIPGSERITL